MNRSDPGARAAATAPARSADVWTFALDIKPFAYERSFGLLTAGERERARRFRFEKHRTRFVAGRSTLRRILADYAECEPERVQIAYGPHGKPYVAGPGFAADLNFSFSNSGAVAAVAIARGAELGLDVEEIREAEPDGVAGSAFSSDERTWFAGLPEAERAESFYALWTCKEAYLKGRGCGLSESPDRFSIALGPGSAARLEWSDIDRSDPGRWLLYRLEVKPGLAACLAVLGGCESLRVAEWPSEP
jgi:4'-phosphopantetheinyl transferase